jgi:protein phosphatase
MKLTIPELSVVALVGPSGSGKSSFARKHFRATEILSSDFCRGLVSDDENSQAATNDAFEVLHFIASKRLAAGKLVVIDATNVQPEARTPIIVLAREYHCIPAAIVFDLPEKLCHERNRSRPDRDFGPHVVRQQSRQLRNSLRKLEREGFRRVHLLQSPAEVDAAEIVREPLWNNLKSEHGPFDIIGDVHGCFDELSDLLQQLGYSVETRSHGDEPTSSPSCTFSFRAFKPFPLFSNSILSGFCRSPSWASCCYPALHAEARIWRHSTSALGTLGVTFR